MLTFVVASLLALNAAPVRSLALELEHLEERATCQSYAATELSKCASATQFCSSFLKTQPPVATTTVRTTFTSSSTFTTTVTTASFYQTSSFGASCTTVAKREAVTAAAPPAGTRCNVNGIAATKIESGCSCLPSFTYKGKRPKATSTVTSTIKTSVADISTSSVTATTTVASPQYTNYQIQALLPSAGTNINLGSLTTRASDQGDMIIITNNAASNFQSDDSVPVGSQKFGPLNLLLASGSLEAVLANEAESNVYVNYNGTQTTNFVPLNAYLDSPQGDSSCQSRIELYFHQGFSFDLASAQACYEGNGVYILKLRRYGTTSACSLGVTLVAVPPRSAGT